LAGKAFIDILFGVTVHTGPKTGGCEPGLGGLDA